MTRQILIVEDDASIRESLIDLLEAEDYHVLVAENGTVGLQLARGHLPDLIICDIMMPDLDGYSVLSELQNAPATSTIPFIFLTAKADRIDQRRGMGLGADDYLTKPFTRTDILQAIEARLSKRVELNRQHDRDMAALRNSIALALPHELRTPLSGIKTGASVIYETGEHMSSAEVKNVADIIHQSAERLERLIINYLTYAETEVTLRDSATIAALRTRRTVSTRLIVKQAVMDVAHRHRREADLQLELADTSATIADLHLAKIAEELADNAFKFSSAGRPVRVTSEAAGDRFILIVADQGRGLTPEQIAHVGAYLQFDRKLHEQQGSGLGLAIARNLAALYGGELTLESDLGRGTTARVSLPV